MRLLAGTNRSAAPRSGLPMPPGEGVQLPVCSPSVDRLARLLAGQAAILFRRYGVLGPAREESPTVDVAAMGGGLLALPQLPLRADPLRKPESTGGCAAGTHGFR